MLKKNFAPYSFKFCAVAVILGICMEFVFFGAQSAAKAAADVSLPTYKPGVTFVYSDGKSETVQEVRDDLVVWRDNRNQISIGSRDFTLRHLQWETKSR